MTKAKKITDKIFGGINMSWLKVVLFAVASAVVTAVFLIVPMFEKTSFHEMGVSFEAWILFAIIIMTNCKSALDSALKTFVFFLVSQPLIYLLQVPFYFGGFQIFMYYRYWFFWTLLTFPMAFVGWYLTKRNWLSLLVLMPMVLLLTLLGAGYVQQTMHQFPHYMLAAVFCFAQILLYLFAFCNWKQCLAGVGIAAVASAVFFIVTPQQSLSVSMPLPDDPGFSESAVVSFDESMGKAVIEDSENGQIQIEMKKYGDTVMEIRDGETLYRYNVKGFNDEGVNRVHVTAEPVELNTVVQLPEAVTPSVKASVAFENKEFGEAAFANADHKAVKLHIRQQGTALLVIKDEKENCLLKVTVNDPKKPDSVTIDPISVQTDTTTYFPNISSLSDSAKATFKDASAGKVTVTDAKNNLINLKLVKYGTFDLILSDNGKDTEFKVKTVFRNNRFQAEFV